MMLDICFSDIPAYFFILLCISLVPAPFCLKYVFFAAPSSFSSVSTFRPSNNHIDYDDDD